MIDDIKLPTQLEKGGVPSPGWGRDPAPSGGLQTPWGLVHQWGKMEQEVHKYSAIVKRELSRKA